MAESVRVDKWLFAVRIYKTRSIATDECQKGRISVNGVVVKPSREVKPGDIVEVKKTPVTYKYKVVDLIEKRIGAKVAAQYVEDMTPPEALEILEVQRNMQWISRDKGTGRPTKKDRRDLDNYFDW